jgi:hypothetical protein
MKNGIKVVRSAKRGQFVLSSDRGEKISAVEGMKLSPRMSTILKESRERGLSGDERRTLIREQAHRKK